MRIIHITEAMGGGVAHSLSQLARAQAADGHEVTVVHSVRPDTPVDRLPELYPFPISRIQLPMVTKISPVKDAIAFFKICLLLQAERPDVIHLHSSKAGILGRLAAYILGKSNVVFYSPRGFAFLREDVPPFRRNFFLYLERIACKLGGVLIGCSKTELDLARFKVLHPRSYLVENSVDLKDVPVAKGSQDDVVTVITSGRICYQKAPWRFRILMESCSDLPVNFVWLGDGDLQGELVEKGRPSSNLRITGWLPREEVYELLAVADIFVLPSLWEGMPLALIEAQAGGLPAVVSDVVGNRDVVIHGETGFVCKTDSEMIDKTRLLIKNVVLRRQMGLAACDMAKERFSVARMHSEMMKIYGCQN